MNVRTLSEIEKRWARAELEAIFPRTSGVIELGIADLDIEKFLNQVFAGAPVQAAMGLRLAIWIVALAPLFVIGRVTTIVGLSVEERSALLKKLIVSPTYAVRQLVMALKTVGAMLFAGAPAVRARIVAPIRAAGGSEAAPVQLRLARTRLASQEPLPAKVPSNGRRIA